MLQNLFISDYKLIINPKLKYIHLIIDEQGELLVKSPHKKRFEIEELIHTKKAWITQAKQKYAQKKGKLPNYITKNETLYYMGRAYPLMIKQNAHHSFSYLPDIGFEINYTQFSIEKFNKEIDAFYRYKTKVYMKEWVENEAKRMGLYPTAINFRKTKRQWGSCSTKNRLSFHAHLIKLPVDVIQYIIIHELAHIRHKHHQKAFWQEVEQFCPNYRELEKQLKEYVT